MTTSLSDLAKERINILAIYPGNENYDSTVAFEYQYRPKDGSPRTWHKGAMIATGRHYNLVTNKVEGETIYDQVLRVVREAKKELE